MRIHQYTQNCISFICIIVLSILGITGCSPENTTLSGHPSTLKISPQHLPLDKNLIEDIGDFENKTLSPRPSGDPNSIVNQLKRFKNQKKFLSPLPFRPRVAYAEASRASGDRSPSLGENRLARSIEEGDVFKVGKPGQKLLYLLNNYRGMQVVSFQDGLENPKLLSRAEFTGEWPEKMYYDENQDRIIVLDNGWDQKTQQHLAHLTLYQVADPTHARRTQAFNIEGNIIDSRKVGHVLYLVVQTSNPYTSYYPYRHPVPAPNETFAKILTYSLEGEEVKLVNNYVLPFPLEYGELLNIVEQRQGNDFHYYLLATLRSGQLWNTQSHHVAVVDISDPNGEVKPLIIASLQGTIHERSQLTLKDNVLITASNFTPTGDNKLRVAVETFSIPQSPTLINIISKQEADYKKQLLTQALVEAKENQNLLDIPANQREKEIEKYRRQLITGKILYHDQKIDLLRKYISTEGNFAMALTPTHSLIVDAPEGLSALIRDVRATENKLYIFWVPQNWVDPLDVFDISKPEEGIDYQGRLTFDGWIERAIPVRYQNHDYIVGLGFKNVTESTGSGGSVNVNRRYPQAILFALNQEPHGGITQKIIDQTTLSSANFWVDFNAPDRFIEFRFDESQGTGHIMFPISHWDQQGYRTGAKLIGFNFKQLPSQSFFQEGAFLQSPSHQWAKRVFNNPELERISSLSDQELAIFDLDIEGQGVGLHDQIAAAMKTLELARNIEGYFHLNIKETMVGVQIISHHRTPLVFHSENGDEGQETQLRSVSLQRADEESAKILDSKSLPGQFSGIYEFPNHHFAIIHTVKSVQERMSNDPNAGYNYKQKHYLSLIAGLKGDQSGRIQILDQVTLDQQSPEIIGHSELQTQLQSSQPFLTAFNEIFMVKDNQILMIKKIKDRLQVIPITLTENTESATLTESGDDLGNENVDGQNSKTIMALGNHLVFTSFQVVNHRPDHSDENVTEVPIFQLQKNFMQRSTLKGQQLILEPAINIPGEPISLSENLLITKDLVVNDPSLVIGESGANNFTLTSTPHLEMLQLSNLSSHTPQFATLKENYNALNLDVRSFKVLNYQTLIFTESLGATHGQQKTLLSFLTIDSDFKLRKETYQMEFLKLPENPFIYKIIPFQRNHFFALIASGKSIQFAKFNLTDKRPQALSLVPMNALMEKSPLTDVIELHTYLNPETDFMIHHRGYRHRYYSPYGYFAPQSNLNKIHYTPTQKSVEIAEGFYGIRQFFIND